jgi:hypothetical protein
MLEFLNTPWGGAVVALLLSGAIRALPEPKESCGTFYAWLYNFGQFILQNYDKIGAKK